MKGQPALSGAIEALKGTSLWKEVPLPRHPQSALPPFPPKRPPQIHTAGPQFKDGHQRLRAWQRSQAPWESSQPSMEAGIRPGHSTVEMRPGLANPPRHIAPPAALQVGQFAQVLHYGRDMGLVQLTDQGWAGPPHLLSLFLRQQQNMHHPPRDVAEKGVQRLSRPAMPSWNQAEAPSATMSLASHCFGDKQPQLQSCKRRRLAPQSKAWQSVSAKVDWRAEDIDLVEDSKSGDDELIAGKPTNQAEDSLLDPANVETSTGTSMFKSAEPQSEINAEDESASLAVESQQLGISMTHGSGKSAAAGCPSYLQVAKMLQSSCLSVFNNGLPSRVTLQSKD